MCDVNLFILYSIVYYIVVYAYLIHLLYININIRVYILLPIYFMLTNLHYNIIIFLRYISELSMYGNIFVYIHNGLTYLHFTDLSY